MNQYETIFILTPVLSDAQFKEAVDKFRNLILNNGGQIVYEENWGLRKLAYPIQKKSTGFYYLIEFKAPTAFIKTLEIEFKRDERIMRFLTVRMDKYAIEYSHNRRSKKENVEQINE